MIQFVEEMESLITQTVTENVTMLKKPKMDGARLKDQSVIVHWLSNQFVEKMESAIITLVRLNVTDKLFLKWPEVLMDVVILAIVKTKDLSQFVELTESLT